MSVISVALSLLGFALLTVGTAIFVAAEFSLTALERSTVDANARTGDRRDKLVQRAHRTLSFQLSGAQLGISITTLATGYLAEPVLSKLLTPLLTSVRLPAGAVPGVSLVLAILLATSLSMVFGELVPKNLAVSRPVPTARASAGPQMLFSFLLAPAIRLTNGTANAILRRLGIEPAEALRSARSPQELGALVRGSAERGGIDAGTAELVDRSLQFGARTAEEFMTPRTEIEVLRADDTVADLLNASAGTGFSRFPVIEGDLDETLGIVHFKQVFGIPAEQRAHTRLAQLAIAVPRVPSTLPGDTLMTEIRANGLQTAIVVDEYGGTSGIATLEDLVEELIGEVADEHDRAPLDVVRARDWFTFPAQLRPDELEERTGVDVPESGHYETVTGFILERLGRMADVGDTVTTDLGEFRVERMEGRRIDRVRFTPSVSPEQVTLL